MARPTARCGACGVSLPPGGVRCPTCGHTQGEAISVEIGRSSAGSRGRSRRDLVIVAAVIALVVAALVYAGDDGPSEKADAASSAPASTTSTSRTTTTTVPTTTTTILLPALQLLEPSGVRLLVGTLNGVFLVDLDTGERALVELPTESPLIPRAGGVVTMSFRGLEFWTDPFVTGTSIRSSQNASAIPSQEADRVWLIDYSSGGINVLEVDTAGRVTAGPFVVASSGGFIGSVSDGIVGSAHGSIFVLDRDGQSRRIAYGDVIASGGDQVLATTCDDAVHCGAVLINVTTGATRSLVQYDSADSYPQGVISPDGSEAALSVYQNGSARLQIVDLASGATHVLPPTLDEGGLGALSYSQDSRWLFFLAGGDVYAHPVGTDQFAPINTGSLTSQVVTAI